MPGIKADFVDSLEPRHKCPICSLVVRSPVQADCGHIFCNDCLKQALSNGEKMLCPIDDEKISKMFPDNACKKEIQKLRVRCRYASSNGCQWIGTLGDEDIHYTACEYRNEQCPDCGSHMVCTKLKRHAEMECPMRLMTCKNCMEQIPVSHLELHLQKNCPGVEMACPNNCNPSVIMKREELDKHLSPTNGNCPLSQVECPYKLLGCDFITQRSKLDNHLKAYGVQHDRLMVNQVISNSQQNAELRRTVQFLEDQMSNLSIRVVNLEQTQDLNTQKIEEVLIQSTLLQSKRSDRVENVLASSGPSPVATTTRGIGAVPPETRSSDDAQLVQRIPELVSKCQDLNQAVEKIMSNSVDQELRLQLLEQATHNGILVWKIDEISRRMDEAVKGITVSLFSAPFYTDQRGYKMCARCYLNGDGMGKGTHFSLFFVVMKGLYDALLRWPFHQRVTMTLINQSGGRNMSDTFRPDVRSSSFQRPVNREMNVASGCPRFVRIEELLHGGYIKEDCIFVKINVDCTDLYGSPMM